MRLQNTITMTIYKQTAIQLVFLRSYKNSWGRKHVKMHHYQNLQYKRQLGGGMWNALTLCIPLYLSENEKKNNLSSRERAHYTVLLPLFDSESIVINDTEKVKLEPKSTWFICIVQHNCPYYSKHMLFFWLYIVYAYTQYVRAGVIFSLPLLLTPINGYG